MPVFTTKIAGAVATAADLATIPTAAGVYMVGVNINGEFCPLYVGQAANLRARINNHYNRSGGYLNERKELFDFLTHPIADVYDDIEIWNKRHWCNGPILDPYIYSTCPTHVGISKINFKWSLYHAIQVKNNSLIYFNCRSFFDSYLAICGISSYVDGTWHTGAVIDLNTIGTPDAINLSNRIENVKNYIDNNFYYAYVAVPGRLDLNIIELATKCALENLGIYTYACVACYSNYKLGGVTLGRDIDLTALNPGGPFLPIYNSTGAPLLILT